MSLTPKQRRFVNEYCVDENATQAALRAGYSENGAGQQGHLLLKNDEIRAAIKDRMEEVAVAASVTPEMVLREWYKIAFADPDDLVQVRRTCCRHCHGFGHQYQWTEAEYAAAVDKAIEAGKPAPDGMGGFGFDLNAEPHPGCPECGGQGVAEVHVADTRKLKRHPLYAGAERTRNGIKVNMRDKDAALFNLSRYLGMQVDRKEISGPGGGPLPMAHISADDLTDDQLAAIIKAGDGNED
jgi:phage terminase small subunit